MTNKHSPVFLAFIAVFISACAKVMMPTGGEVDNVPPKLVNSIPENFKTNFSEESFELFFDEFVEIKNATQTVIFSPPPKKNPQYLGKGKSIAIKFNEPLDSNKTYVINFADAIVDFTENNPAQNLKFVFSTGSFIDSLTLTGKVIDSWTSKPIEKATAMLYPYFTDSAAVAHRPYYIAKTNEEGIFEFSFLKANKYQLVVVGDENGNLKYDIYEEKIAFADSAIHLEAGKKIELPLLKVFKEKKKIQGIKKFEEKSRIQMGLTLNLPSKNLKILIAEDDSTKALSSIKYEKLEGKSDSLILWLPKLPEEKEFLDFYLIDEEIAYYDTLKAILPNPPKARKLKEGQKIRDLKFETNLKANFRYMDSIFIRFSEPIYWINKQAFKVLEKDSIPMDFQLIESEKDNRTFYFISNFKESEKYSISAPDSSVVSMYNSVSDSLFINGNAQRYAHFGSLNLVIEFDEKMFKGSPILEIYFSNKKLFKRIANLDKKNLVFDNLEPDKYTLKLIDDKNNNQKWDTGNYLEMVQPEKVYQYNQEIDVRSNWDLDIKWTVLP